MNQCWFSHSTQNLPFKNSTNALSAVLPGRLKSSVTPEAGTQVQVARDEIAALIDADRQRADAVAEYAGGPLGLVALGAGWAQTVGTITAGLTQRVTDGLDLFSIASAQTGSRNSRAAISTGVRLRL